MTVREEAYGLIDSLPEDSVRAVIQIMLRMSPAQKKIHQPAAVTPKMKAFYALQEMRKEGAKYDFSTDERAAALDEKLGSFVWKRSAE